MPDANGDDDFPKNNAIRWGVGVDNTDPVSSHTLNPPDPDGENNWYVNDLEVTLSAYDPLVMDVSSGADFINYRVNDGTTQTIDGNEIIEGTFLITRLLIMSVTLKTVIHSISIWTKQIQQLT
jgi:hypothetical protein